MNVHQQPGFGGGPPPAGLYPDPGGSGWLRWWTGAEWSEHATPAQRALVPPEPRAGHGANVLAIVALVTGVTGSFPAALVCGIIARRQVARGEGTPTDGRLALAGIILATVWAVLIVGFLVLALVIGLTDDR